MDKLYTTVRRLGQYGLLCVALLMPFMAQAATPAAEKFKSGFDGFSDKPRSFPEHFEIFGFDDREVPVVFGKDQPWRLINFWASWCPPCVKEMPSLKTLQEQTVNLKNLQVLLVSVDMPLKGEGLQYVIKNKNLPDVDAVYVKDYLLWQRFELKGIPTTILVSPEGKIAYTLEGDADWQSEGAKAFLHSVLPPSVFP